MNIARQDKFVPPLALTMGDPAGIGPDITLMSWLQRDVTMPVFSVLADPAVLEARAEALSLSVPLATVSNLSEAQELFAEALPVFPISLEHAEVGAGQPDCGLAGGICGSIETAVSFVYSGDASAVVTNPINKAVLYDAGFAHPGHTEYLGALARERGDSAFPVMMLSGGGLRVVPATIHIPLKDVPSALSTQSIAHILSIMSRELTESFGIGTPRIAVTGLNPHAGEDGALGTEESEIIEPAIAQARDAGLQVTGPYPADTIFHEEARSSYDAVLAMYHDQALIPVKTIAFDKGVNVTLGLPFVRTSPDHGTAYGIAGTGRANPTSLIEALKLAGTMVSNRAKLV